VSGVCYDFLKALATAGAVGVVELCVVLAGCALRDARWLSFAWCSVVAFCAGLGGYHGSVKREFVLRVVINFK